MADTKRDLIAGLRAAFDDWESFLAGKTKADMTYPPGPGEWAIKDVLAHLFAWQRISVARLQAALSGTEPDYPAWLGEAGPFYAEENLDEINARISELYRDKHYSGALRMWRDNFRRLLDLAEALPEDALLEPGRYAWMRGDALSAVLDGSRDHHEEHLKTASQRNA